MFKWYKIFNKATFEALGLVSRTYKLNLEGIGQKEILVTKGNCIGLTFEGVFLVLSEDLGNPFKFGGFAIYENANQDVFLGVAIED